MNQVYSPEVRNSVIELYQSDVPVNEIVSKTGVSRSRVYTIIKEANVPHHRNKQSHADEFNSEANHQSPRSNSDAEKKALIDQFQTSGNKTAFAKEHQIPRSTLYRWSKDEIYLQDRKGTTINIKMYYEALRSKEKLQQIINVLQTVECTVSAPLQVKMEEMEKLGGQYSSRVLCAALLVDRGTYANFLKRNKREQSWFVTRRAELKQEIESIFNEHHQIPGIRKIRALLVQQGYRVSEHMVGELMKELGISSIRNGSKQQYMEASKAKQSDINIRNLYPCYLPNQIWSSDFTYFTVGSIKYCVCIIIDLCSKVVVAYKVGRKATTQMLTQSFLKAIREREPQGILVFHSDQGS